MVSNTQMPITVLLIGVNDKAELSEDSFKVETLDLLEIASSALIDDSFDY